MNLPYIIDVALVLVACLVFYKILLGRETFYKVNRYLLILCLGISFGLPLLRVPAEFSLRNRSAIDNPQRAIDNRPKAPTEASEQLATGNEPKAPTEASEQLATGSGQPTIEAVTTGERVMNWLFWLYWFGVIVFGIRFLFQVGLLLW